VTTAGFETIASTLAPDPVRVAARACLWPESAVDDFLAAVARQQGTVRHVSPLCLVLVTGSGAHQTVLRQLSVECVAAANAVVFADRGEITAPPLEIDFGEGSGADVAAAAGLTGMALGTWDAWVEPAALSAERRTALASWRPGHAVVPAAASSPVAPPSQPAPRVPEVLTLVAPQPAPIAVPARTQPPAPATAPPVTAVDNGLRAWADGSGTTADQLAAIGVVVARGGVVVCEASECFGPGSNNDAELRAIARALTLASRIAGRDAALTLYSDSEFALGAAAPGSTWNIRNEQQAALVAQLRAEAARWPRLQLRHVKGHAGDAGNERADWLAGRARKAAVAASGPPLVVIDTETTGRSPALHQVLELAAAETDPSGRVVTRRACSRVLLEPWASIDPGALAVHGYDPRSPGWAASARPLRDVMERFARWLPEHFIPVAHNASFDLGFLRASFERAGLATPLPFTGKGLCTVQLGRRLAKRGLVPGAALDVLCTHFGVSNQGAHGAARDVERLLAIYPRMAALESAGQPQLAIGGGA